MLLFVFIVCGFVTILLPTITALPATTPELSTHCDEGWRSFDGHCYLFVQSSETFDDARVNCSRWNSYPLEIETEAERKFIQKIVLDRYHFATFWVGATYRFCEEHYRYLRSENLVQTEFWAEEEPDKLGKEYCISMFLSDVNLRFVDVTCCTRIHYVCEKNELQ